MKTIKRWLRLYTPQWVLAVGFLFAMILIVVSNNVYDWFKGENI